MGLIHWDEALATGHPELDEQHRSLVLAYNGVVTALAGGGNRDSLEAALTHLKQRTVVHFAWEEKLMDVAGYAAASTHKATHHDLVAQLGELVERFKSDRTALTPPVMDFLEGWLIYHLKGDDVRLATALTPPQPAGNEDRPR